MTMTKHRAGVESTAQAPAMSTDQLSLTANLARLRFGSTLTATAHRKILFHFDVAAGLQSALASLHRGAALVESRECDATRICLRSRIDAIPPIEGR
jgi:hypothetical protein